MCPVVVVDGTFLTERYKGTLIIATCQDANMHIYPLAWAFVDSENDASWHWFFMNLKGITGGQEDLVLISDRHMSLISAVQTIFQNTRHAYCIYHIKGNLRTVTRKTDTISLFNKAAEAYTIEEFHKYMSQIQATDEKESLNSVFKKARQTPILVLFDSIGKKLQSWFYERREAARSCTGNLTPAMEEKLRNSHEKAKKFTVEPIDQTLYVVRSGATNFTVNFVENTCTCRKFQLDHLPCEHAIAAAKKRGFSIYLMCSSYYSVDYWRKAYAETIFPVPNENEWEIPDNIKEMIILPPIVRQRDGRRRTTRIPSTKESAQDKNTVEVVQHDSDRLRGRSDVGHPDPDRPRSLSESGRRPLTDYVVDQGRAARRLTNHGSIRVGLHDL
ncbi:hypothetical protein DH2020_016966 [Rehmannia glutinosa]|uniref:SWIM-type domain-containing protein n=1 Tax=Rehmannia glutinosa TaxID=99300 RepID=A0ABR0WR62_REHGL